MGEEIKQLGNCFSTRKSGARSGGEKLVSQMLSALQRAHQDASPAPETASLPHPGAPNLSGQSHSAAPRPGVPTPLGPWAPHSAPHTPGSSRWPPVTPRVGLEGGLPKRPITAQQCQGAGPGRACPRPVPPGPAPSESVRAGESRWDAECSAVLEATKGQREGRRKVHPSALQTDIGTLALLGSTSEVAPSHVSGSSPGLLPQKRESLPSSNSYPAALI
nr:translation initiation factor IF-2-like [Gorilla gorilla gorilla]